MKKLRLPVASVMTEAEQNMSVYDPNAVAEEEDSSS